MPHHGGPQGLANAKYIQSMMHQHQLSFQGVQHQGNYDYMAPEVNYQHYREFDFDESDRPAIYPHESYGKLTYPITRDSQPSLLTKDWESVCPKFIPYVGAETELKQKSTLFAVTWMKGGKYVLTGSCTGDIIQWNAQIFDRKQTSVHQSRVQTLCWTNYEKFLLSGDNSGVIIYSDAKMNLHFKIKTHNNLCVRDLSLSPASLKFVSCSDDTTARVFDFLTGKEELVYRAHGSDVKSCDWHPT